MILPSLCTFFLIFTQYLVKNTMPLLQESPSSRNVPPFAYVFTVIFDSRWLRLKCDGTLAETRFRLSAKRMSPFKSAGTSVQSTTGSQSVRISGINAGYTMFRGSVKSTGYPLHSPVPPFTSPPAHYRVPSHFSWTLILLCTDSVWHGNSSYIYAGQMFLWVNGKSHNSPIFAQKHHLLERSFVLPSCMQDLKQRSMNLQGHSGTYSVLKSMYK